MIYATGVGAGCEPPWTAVPPWRAWSAATWRAAWDMSALARWVCKVFHAKFNQNRIINEDFKILGNWVGEGKRDSLMIFKKYYHNFQPTFK